MKRVIPYGTFALQFILFFFLCPVQEARANILYVGPNETYDNIQWALSQASAGDTIMVRDGVYVQEIKVRIPVVLMAENRHQAVIGDGSGTRAMISIRQGIVDGAVIDGFKFAPGTYGSIWVGDMDAENAPSNCIIKNNHIEGRNKGIIVSPTASNTTLSGNFVSGCGSNGIMIQGYGNTLVSGNTLENCDYWGIFWRE